MRKSLILLLLVFSAMTSYAYDVEIDGIYYNLVPKAKQASVTNNGKYSPYGSYSGNVIIPEIITSDGVEYSVTSIGDDAFSSCSSLTSIDIPNSVTSIGDYAFPSCTSLTSIVIPNSVTSIGTFAFQGCSSLTSIVIPNSVTSIGVGAFSYCESLTSIVIPNSVTSIGSDAFYYCTSLTSIDIPNSVTSIYGSAFSGCNSLTSIVIPNSVTYIDNAFNGCEKLTDITIGSSVTYVGSETFANCPNLENVYCNAINPPSTESNAFDGSYIEYANLYVPAESLGKYRSTAPWSSFGNISALTLAEPEDVALVDGEEYTNMLEKSCNTLTYTRNFTNTNWNAFYVPFAMSYDEWAADFEVARLNDVHQFDDNEDGEIDRTVLELIKLKDGSSIEPNTPYLIKAREVGEKTITLTDATLYAAEENSFDVTSWFTKFTFTGTYSTITDMATKGHYAMADGGLKQATTDAATLGAFRWYLDVTDRNGNPTPLAGKKVLLSFDDGEVTEVANVSANSCSKVSGVHTVSGMKIAKDKALQQKGVYIIDGNKILVR